MSELALPGLRASEPIGFLAALGLLRVVTGRGTFGAAKLGWSDDSAWPAVLSTEHACDPDRLLDDLLAHMTGRAAAPAFSARPDAAQEPIPDPWADVKVPLDDYRTRLVAVRATADRTTREAADFLAALGCESVSVGGKDAVKPSALHMTSGNQKFLTTCQDIAGSLDPGAALPSEASCPPAEAFREAVFDRRTDGPPGWRAADRMSAMGFDAAREAVYALVADAPGPAGPRSTRAAVWLAVEGLSLFPSLPAGGRLHTRGFDPRATAFRWPVWDGLLRLGAVRTLVGGREVVQPKPEARRLRQLGIRAVMESARVTIGQGYGQLRPAVRVGESAG